MIVTSLSDSHFAMSDDLHMGQVNSSLRSAFSLIRFCAHADEVACVDRLYHWSTIRHYWYGCLWQRL